MARPVQRLAPGGEPRRTGSLPTGCAPEGIIPARTVASRGAHQALGMVDGNLRRPASRPRQAGTLAPTVAGAAGAGGGRAVRVRR